jgi:o-succinylbenzoate synthase
MKASFKKYKLKFHRPAGTSRGVMLDREVWFLFVWDEKSPQKIGIGEVAPLKNLSCDAGPELENKIAEVCENPNDFQFWIDEGLIKFPSLRFALETAILDLKARNERILFPSDFTQGKVGIPINGLIWMGKADFMEEQIEQKIEQGFKCIKLKIGAIDFETELKLIKKIRERFSAEEVEIRVDANGAFSVEDANKKVEQLAALRIHSIEQPIKAGQQKALFELCKNSPLPIALDEELIGLHSFSEKSALLWAIQPAYIILKPSLHGGIKGCTEWIKIAENLKIGWWLTSALESNIGLNAIAQWAYSLDVKIPQGLGTGQLFTNNIPAPLFIDKAALFFDPENKWNLEGLENGF